MLVHFFYLLSSSFLLSHFILVPRFHFYNRLRSVFFFKEHKSTFGCRTNALIVSHFNYALPFGRWILEDVIFLKALFLSSTFLVFATRFTVHCSIERDLLWSSLAFPSSRLPMLVPRRLQSYHDCNSAH